MKNNIHNLTVSLVSLFIFINTLSIHAQVQPILVLEHIDVEGYSIHDLAFSPDNKTLVTTGGIHAIIWDLKTGEKILTFPKDFGIEAIDFSPDGKMLVSSAFELHVNLWDSQTGEKIHSFQGESSTPQPIRYTNILFSKNGEKIICCENGGLIYLYDLASKVGKKLSDFGGTYNVEVFPDGKRLLASDYVISLETGEIIHNFDNSVAYLSYDSKEIYTYDGDWSTSPVSKSLIKWNADTYEKISQHPPIQTQNLLRISPNGKMIVSARERVPKNPGHSYVDRKEESHIFDVETNETKRTFAPAGKPDLEIDKVMFSRDGKLLALVSDYTVYIFDVSDLPAKVLLPEMQR